MESYKLSTPSIYPCDIDCTETPSLCIFYAIASLTVIFLAVSLLWFPFLQLIAEINTIIAKVMIYINNQFFGFKNNIFFDYLEASVNSPKLIFAISLICMSYIFYHASGDFLISVACYISTMPHNEYSDCIKQLILEVIVKLIHMKKRKANNNRPPPRRIEV